jgi:RND superfamily putative drug exporter
MHLRVAGKLTGPVIKWFVLAFFLVTLPVTMYFGGKLTEVQNNEMSSWLPETAESTVAFEKLEQFQNTNAIPTVVAYEREGGLTPQDLAKLQADAEEFAGLDGVLTDDPSQPGVIGPLPSQDNQAAQTIVTFDFGSEGWNAMPDAVEEVKQIAESDGLTVDE